jgi:hypothetical protein
MGFLAPWFLGGLAALGVPVFVHLLRRHVTMPRPVSSLMFFAAHKARHVTAACAICCSSRCAARWCCW